MKIYDKTTDFNFINKHLYIFLNDSRYFIPTVILNLFQIRRGGINLYIYVMPDSVRHLGKKWQERCAIIVTRLRVGARSDGGTKKGME